MRIKQVTTSGDRLIVLVNYQSFHVISDLFTSLGLTADIAMFDEAHNVTSKASRTKIEAMVTSKDSGNDDDDKTGSMSEDSGDDDDNETGSVSEDSGDDNDETGSVSGDDETDSLQARKTIFFTMTPTRVMKAHPDIYGDELVQYTYAQTV
ncbi:hypothetical protein AMAG_06347 [Allomyces macrogynus ATCC 38327]|uniref:Uncharacterized protein n=1 Tax=Allomyces macrogynus (strain ATCC 38327) TaxID=578462 RepID=A0A0L0SGF6_ALLM3|nr:hypothetical protein AMAG_06347 [Allomyces macrogynus ATCC 38327]|eukprot:KNE61532.1 hypothetical protein AMAG_06347 [Allomyces macrogynus ATCC 38327]